MVDEEVENILREIRERVRAENQTPALSSPLGTAADRDALHSNGEPGASELLTRIDAHLTTTARAWDRLPPLVSNRTGGLARLELWVKRHLKQATRWYSWEQINFNAAVHQALCDTLAALSDYERRLSAMRTEIEGQAKQLDDQQIELNAQRAGLTTQRTELNAQRTKLIGYYEEFKHQLTETEAQRAAWSTKLSELAQELRARNDHLQDEQRVCFKQLSVEMTEAGVSLDRVRREMESRLEKLEDETGSRKS